jgi:hypothetical protein
MMQIKQIFLGLLIAFTLNSCVDSSDGNGNVVSEKRNISSFNKISISGAYEVLLNNGTQEKLEIEADENLLELIETEVINSTLFITSTQPIGNSESLKLYITTVNLNKIDVSGAIELSNKGFFTTENLEIEVSGAADIELAVHIENLTMNMSGASETTLVGNVDNFEIEISGAGELDALKLKTRNTTIAISGAGSASVFAKKTLDISVSGAASVHYKGSPKITKSISGAGSIEQL